MSRRMSWATLLAVLGVLAIAVLAGCSGASADENPALTEKVQAAINSDALVTPEQVTSITSTKDGKVTVTLWRNSEDLTGLTGAEAAASAAAVGSINADNLLQLVPDATSVEVRDADNKVLAIKERQ